jgi:hypothetical protein
METAIFKKYGFRIMRKLDTFKALVPLPQPQEADFLNEMQIADPGALLDAFPQIFDGCRSESNLRTLRQDYPEMWQRLERQARGSLQHQFDLLGSRLFNLGEDIDWSLDFKSGKRWELRDYRLQKLVDLRDDSDVKVPWELSRCNHFPQLALSFLLTNDHSLAIEFENQVSSWRDGNPFERSINWTCAMETAFRCINWLLAYRMFSEQRRFGEEFKRTLAIELYKGGRFIRSNLEHSGLGFNSNHYLADLVGLLYLGELFKTTSYGQEWRVFALAELEKEIQHQINADGLDYESSLPYHGLVTEMLLYAYLLSQHSDFCFTEIFETSLQRMLANLTLFTQGDGTIMPFGDGDDGRLVKIYGREPRDFRDLIAIGGVLFGTPRPSDMGSVPERLLVFDPQHAEYQESKAIEPQPTSFYYADSGICRLCSHDLTVHFFVNSVGTAGLGNHKHNDVLSFTLECRGKPILIDPGTFVYSADEQERNRFRSTLSHNTVAVDTYEQNRMVGGLLFMLRRDSRPEVVQWESNELHDLVVAENDGYCRFDDPVIHRRSLFLHKDTQVLLVRDELIAQGRHRLDFNFHCDRARITLLHHDLIRLQPDGGQVSVLMSCCESRLQLGITSNLVSPSYGVAHAGIVVAGSVKTMLPFTALFAFMPMTQLDAADVGEQIAAARRAAQW